MLLNSEVDEILDEIFILNVDEIPPICDWMVSNLLNFSKLADDYWNKLVFPTLNIVPLNEVHIAAQIYLVLHRFFSSMFSKSNPSIWTWEFALNKTQCERNETKVVNKLVA